MEIKELGIRVTATPREPLNERLVDERDELACEALDEQFRRQRRELGVAQASRLWFEPVLDTWRAWIEDPRFDELDCEAQALCELAVTVTDSLAMRDALIMMLIMGTDHGSGEEIMEFAVHPHTRASGDAMGRMLTEAFDDPQARPDCVRVERGIAALEQCAQVVPDQYCAQPLAMAAYACWWIGDARAMPMAMQAVGMDDDATLAGIVIAAMLCDIHPAWLCMPKAPKEACTAGRRCDGARE